MTKKRTARLRENLKDMAHGARVIKRGGVQKELVLAALDQTIHGGRMTARGEAHMKAYVQKRAQARVRALTLRAMRKSKGLTMQAVSEQTNIPLATIQALETGRGKNYNVELKHTLADFYHIPMLTLFPEERERIELIKGTHRQVQMFIPREERK